MKTKNILVTLEDPLGGEYTQQLKEITQNNTPDTIKDNLIY